MSELVLSLPTRGQFSEVIGSKFKVSGADPIEFDLIDVESRVSTERHENFSLLFRAPAETSAEQRMFLMEHETLGRMELFLVPIKKDGDGIIFEAVFNLIREV